MFCLPFLLADVKNCQYWAEKPVTENITKKTDIQPAKTKTRRLIEKQKLGSKFYRQNLVQSIGSLVLPYPNGLHLPNFV
jgi:hypothetical protein